MGKIELIDTGRLTEKQARLNMEKCAENTVMQADPE